MLLLASVYQSHVVAISCMVESCVLCCTSNVGIGIVLVVAQVTKHIRLVVAQVKKHI